MRALGKIGYVVEYSWLKDKPKWHAAYTIQRGVGRYIIFETKKKALLYTKRLNDNCMITRIIKWKREGVLYK